MAMTDREAFEVYAKSKCSAEFPTWWTNDAWNTWQAATKAERERWVKRVLEPVKFALTSEIESLRAQLAECQRDAERYRWLRNNTSIMTFEQQKWVTSHKLDMQVDLAMSEKG